MKRKIIWYCFLILAASLVLVSCSNESDRSSENNQVTEIQQEVTKEDPQIITIENSNKVKKLLSWTKGEPPIWSFAWSFDGQTLAVPVANFAYLLDSQNLDVIDVIDTTMLLHSVAYSPDGSTLATGSEIKRIMLWDTENGDILKTLEGHNDTITSLNFSPDGLILASGSWDRTINLWDVESGVLIHKLEGHNNGVTSVAFSPDGYLLASGSSDNTIRLWDVKSGELQRTLKGHEDRVTSVSFSPKGNELASGSWDGTIRVWNVENGDLLRSLEGEGACIAYSPDGKIIASGGTGKVYLWDVANSEILNELHDLDDPDSLNYAVLSIAFSPDGRSLVSGSADGKCRLWGVP